jgi:pSer/pThr/pTyr-binding forkhead associated (FHA) protein
MSFLIQRRRGGALTLAEVAGDVLRIGRGTRAELRSDNPAVSLDHATIAHDAAGYSITDLGSITGTYVNGRPVETSRLAKGDVIEIGDLRIEVQAADAAKPLFVRITSTVAAAQAEVEEEQVAPKAGPRGGVVTAPKVDYVTAYRLQRPYLTKLSLMALLLIVGFAILAEVTSNPRNQVAFMPGGVSSAHARVRNGEVARDCHACHDPFHGVTDAKCIVCHKMGPHAPTQTAAAPGCISCHPEHRGAVKLAMISDTKCTTCHADLAAHDTRLPPPAMAHIRVFDETHPDIDKPPDTDTLRFNHKLHLGARGIFNGEGKREVLQCTGCHRLVPDKSGKFDPKPIAFATDCQRCHRLTFDARYPNAEVPHGGDPGIVYGFVGGIYSGDSSLAGKNPEEVRRILTTRPAARSAGENAVVSAEHVIKAKCTLCHELKTVNGRLAATAPVLRTRWIEHARFSHSEPHRACETCHAAARESAKTSDILLPSTKDCAACHAPRAGKPASTCLSCHEYHESSRKVLAANVVPGGRAQGLSLLGGGRPGMLGWIFLAAIVVLLVVVLIPVGIALARRVSRREPPPPPARPQRAAAPPPPMQPVSDLRTEKVAAVSAPSAAPPPPPRPSPKTEAGDLTAVESIAPVHEGTEMVQWYGMLVCTAGPIEGKRFIVEEPGFYIGRDPALAQVVVPDTRISKRHVRIVVRDGKVHAIDQDSTNGTFLGKAGGERVTDVQLRKGDTLVLADNAATFTYQI